MSSPALLRYAPPDPLSAALRQFRNWVLAAFVLLFAGVLGAYAGRALTPTTYRASGLYQVRFPGGTAAAVSLATFENAQRAQAASMRTPAALATIADGLRRRGHNFPYGPAGVAYVGQHLQIQPVTSTTLFEVRFESPNSKLSIDAVSDVISMASATTVNRMASTWIAAPPLASPHRSPVGAAIGALVGVLAVSAMLLMLRNARRQRA